MIGEWTELTTRKHKHILLGDLKKWVEDEIKDGNYGEDKDDYMVQCPYCLDAHKKDKSYSGPYTKLKLYVTKDLSLGHCFRCDSIFINNDESLRYGVTAPEPPISIRDFQLCKLTGQVWNLDLFNTFDIEDELGMNYLIKRRHHFMKNLKSILNIRFSNHNPVIPFFYRGELIYYQIKLAFGDSKIPYFSPPIKHKPAYIIEHGDNKKFVVSEGTFDGIADLILYPDRTPFCILGSSITDYQITMLRTYVPEDILVYMDDTELSIKVANKIRSYIPYANVNIRPSDGQDPEEYLKYKIKQDEA